MAGVLDTYKSKVRSADEAVQLVSSGDKVVISHGVSQPPKILAAIANRVRQQSLLDLSIYYIHAEPALADTLLQYDLMDNVSVYCGFFSRYEKQLLSEGEKHGRKVVFFQPNTLSEYPRILSECVQPDCCVLTVSQMDEAGYCSLGTNADYSMAAIASAKTVIAEVNVCMPYTYGNNRVHITELSAIVENNQPLHQVIARQPRKEEYDIAKRIAKLIPDGATLQMGASGVSYALCEVLRDHQDLGLHTELFSKPMMPLIESGVITGNCKTIHQHKHVFTLCFSDQDLYQFMDHNPAIEAYPANYINNPAIIAQNHKMHAINSVVEIDLYGQTTAEVVGWRQYSGPGGQNDFVRGASRSKGGKAILAFSSTAKSGAVSRIVPKLNGMMTNSRLDVQWVVTEYGAKNLFGMTTTERALALIELAHPDHRAALHDSAVDMNLLPPSTPRAH